MPLSGKKMLKLFIKAGWKIKMEYHFKIHRDDELIWAECIELEGCSTQGKSMNELKKNLYEALNLYLDEPENTSIDFPSSDNRMGEDIISVKVDPEIAFALILKKYRRKHRLTQQEFADRLCMSNIFSYQRLERKSNPSLRTLQKINTVLPDFPIEPVFS